MIKRPPTPCVNTFLGSCGQHQPLNKPPYSHSVYAPLFLDLLPSSKHTAHLPIHGSEQSQLDILLWPVLFILRVLCSLLKFAQVFEQKTFDHHEIGISVFDSLLTLGDHIAALYGLTVLCSGDSGYDHQQGLCVFHTQF